MSGQATLVGQGGSCEIDDLELESSGGRPLLTKCAPEQTETDWCWFSIPAELAGLVEQAPAWLDAGGIRRELVSHHVRPDGARLRVSGKVRPV